MNQKQVIIKLFYSVDINQHYILLGENLFIIRANIAGAIQDKEGIDIRRVKGGLKEIQEICLNDDKNISN